ncbi:MAG: CHAT domain-containing protein [Myxococcota bacterium]
MSLQTHGGNIDRRGPVWIGVVIAMFAADVLTACSPSPRSPVARSESTLELAEGSAAFDATVGGCDRTPEANLCVIHEPKTMRISGDATAQLRVDGVAAPSSELGTWDVDLGEEGGSTHRLEIFRDRVRGFVLHVRFEPFPTWLAEAESLVDRDPAAAHRLMSGHYSESQSSASAGVRIATLKQMARSLRSIGDHEQASRLRAAAVDVARNSGDPRSEIDMRTISIFRALKRHELSRSRTILESLPQPLPWDGDAHYLIAYYHAMYEIDAGLLDAGLQNAKHAIEWSTKIGNRRWRRMARRLAAHALERQGLHAEAMTVYSETLRDVETLGECEAAQALNGFGWIQLLAEEATGSPLPRKNGEESLPEMLLRALALHQGDCASDPERAGIIHLNLALALEHRGLYAQAGKHVRLAHSLPGADRMIVQIWASDVEARLARASRKPREAIAHYERLLQLGATSEQPLVTFRAVAGLARSWSDLGHHQRASEFFRQAEDHTWVESFAVPMHEGRARFFAERRRLVDEYARLLLKRGETARALDVLRRHRASYLWTLRRQADVEQLSSEARARWEDAIGLYRRARSKLAALNRERWQLGSDARSRQDKRIQKQRSRVRRALDRSLQTLQPPEPPRLPQPIPGDTLLAFFRGERGWMGFSSVAGRVTWVPRVGGIESPAAEHEGAASPVLAEFDDAIASGERVRVLLAGDSESVDVHGLVWRGQPLIAQKEVVYGIDLANDRHRAHPATRPSRWVGLVDPGADLPWARREARVLEDTFPPEQLRFVSASSQALGRAIERADGFHYAGHGLFSEQGWGGALALADDTRFGANDVLSLAKAPRWIVLSGCDTGRGRAVRSVASLGLAQAFVIAGADAVAATSRPVRDETSVAFAQSFYRSWFSSERLDAPQRYRSAINQIRRERPELDWASFRLFVP